MSIEWTTDLATGMGEIDNQHIELFRRINDLLEACNQGRGKAEVARVIAFLEDYVINHFGEEEKYMAVYAYTEYAGHKAQHKEFMENFSGIRRQFESEGPGLPIVIATNHLVVEWLRDHIRKRDKALGAFLKSKLPA